jgi:hypothetical protein
MRALGKPEVLTSAMLAGLGSAMVCWPRIATASHQRYPVWYLEAVALLGSIVLWGFVFAWHTQYTQRPVFTLKVGLGPFLLATAAGLTAALCWHFALDPSLRARVPEDYPSSTGQWLARTLFSLGLTQLFLVFAPFAWLMRLFRNRQTAFALTVLFGLVVLIIRDSRSPSPLGPEPLFIGLLAFQGAAQALAVYLFLRGGVLLVWWWSLLFQSRHLWNLPGMQ